MKNFLLYFFSLALCVTLLPLAPNLFPAEESRSELIHILDSDSGDVYEMPLEDYVLGVLQAAGYPQTGETLKAIAVAIRSSAVYCEQNTPVHKHAAACDDPQCCAAFDTDAFLQKYIAAVSETAGVTATYEGNAIAAVMHESSGAYTASSRSVYGISVPYLVEVENVSENVTVAQTMTASAFLSALGFARECDLSDLLIAYDKSGRVKTVELGELSMTGTAFAERLALPSACAELSREGDTVTVVCYGKGDGVGMSIHGAEVLASRGWGYRDILQFYYTGVEITASAEL